MAGRIPDKIIDEINHRVRLVDIVGENVQLKKQGNRYLGLCPFHHEKTPSFTIDPERQLFYCFGCQAGGNLFGYVQKRDNLSFVEAVQQLAEEAGIPLPTADGSEVEEATLRRRQQLYDACNAAKDFFIHQLQYHAEGKIARQYLIRRQLQQETIEQFQIGYAPSGWRALTDHLVDQGFPLSVLEEAGLTVKQTDGEGYYDRFRERVIFPIFDYRGRCIAFGGRVLTDQQPKYLNSPQTPLFDKGRSLYGIHLLKTKTNPYVVLYEGYMDFITAWQDQVAYGLAGLGTALTIEQCRLLKRYTSKVILCYDADNAGQIATQRGMQRLRQIGLQVFIARIPEGKDPDDYIRQYGGESFFKKVIEPAAPMYQYYLEVLKEKFPLDTIEGKSSYVRAFASILSTNDSPVEIDGYIQGLAAELQITENAIYREVQKLQRNNPTVFEGKEGTSESFDERKLSKEVKARQSHPSAEETLLRLAFKYPNLGQLIPRELMIEDFDPSYQQLVTEFWPFWKEGKQRPFDEEALSENEKLSAVIAKLTMEDPGYEIDKEKAFQDCTAYLLDQRTRKQLQEQTLQFESLQQEGDIQKIAEVLEQIQMLQRKLGRQR